MKNIFVKLSLVLMLITMSVGQVWAWNAQFKGGNILFDNSQTQWGEYDINFVWGNDGAYYKNKMSAIANTQLYQWSGTCNWGNVYLCFFHGNWGAPGEDKKAYSNISSYASSYSAQYNSTYTFNSGSIYLFTTGGGDKGCSISPNYKSSYSELNTTQKLSARVSVDGGAYSAPSINPATIAVVGKAFSDWKTCNTSKNSSKTGGASYDSPQASIGYTATTTMTVSNVVENYAFEGFYDAETGGNLLSSEMTYAYTTREAKTVYARFTYTTPVVNYYVTGDDFGGWSATQNLMTDNSDGTYTWTSASIPAGTYEFKVTDGTWEHSWGCPALGTLTYCTTSCTGDGNATVTTEAEGPITFVFIKSTEKINVTGTAAVATYSITYECYGATSGCPANVASATALPNPLPTPTKTGFTFGGWYTNSDLTTPASAGATLEENTTLYAKWTEDLSTVWELHIWVDATQGWKKYDFTKATGHSAESIASYTMDLNSGDHDFELIKNGSSYYKNNGTMTSSNNQNWTFTTSASRGKINCNVTGSYTFNINFAESNPKVSVTYPTAYTVTYGSYLSVTPSVASGKYVLSGTELTFTAEDRTGYTFNGFYSDSEFQNQLADGSSNTYVTTADAAISVYAKYTAKQTTITLDKNGGTGGQDMFYVEYNQPTQNVGWAAPTRGGYQFTGYYDAQDGGTKYINADGSSARNWDKDVAAFTLYAHWTEIHVYLEGRLTIRESAGGERNKKVSESWSLTSKNIEFIYNSTSGLYELNTYCSISELSGDDDYIRINTCFGSNDLQDTKYWGAAGDHDVTFAQGGTSVTTLAQNNNKSVKFRSSGDQSGPVILKYNYDTHMLSYTAQMQSFVLNFSATGGVLTATANEAEVTTGSSVEQGSAIVFTATPEAGYYLSAITKNGEEQTVPDRNGDGTYTINATMGGADETWAATFSAITVTPHVNDDVAIVQTGATATVTLSYTPVEPKGDLTFCYTLYKNNAGAWDKVDDLEFTAATLPSVTFTAPMEEGTYRVGVVMHQGATCEGATVGTETFSAEFDIRNVYTVTYGQYPSTKATLTAKVNDVAIGASPAEVSAGSTIVFTVSNIDSKYAVQGWYADAECTRPIYDGVAVNLQSYTLSDLSANAEVYVKFFAPTVVNDIDLKDETNTSTTSFAVGEKITAIPQFEYTGIGDKAYCWEVLDATTNMHVNATIKSIGDKKITIYINEPGNYKLNLTIHEADCNGDQNSSFTTSTFTVADREYYIVGSKFWGMDDVELLETTTRNDDNILLYFRPTLESGEFFFGPMKFGENYKWFRIYDKAKQRFYVGSNGGHWLLRANQEMPMVVANSDKNINVVDNEDNLVLNDQDYYLYIKDGKLIAKAEAPDLSPKVRLAITYTDAAGVHNLYSNEVSLPDNLNDETGEDEANEPSAIISFFVPQGAGVSGISYHMEQQKAGEGWVTAGIALAANPSATESGVYYTTFTQTTAAETHTITLGELTKYVGDYYVRTPAFNSLENYLTNDECKMIFTDRSNGDRFDYFACKWCADANQDVRYCIANIYNPNLSGVLVADDYTTSAGALSNKAANVRFAWQSATNYMFRAYLEGSSTEDYLKIMPDPDAAENHKIYTTAGGSTVLSNTKFTDLQDWTYTIAEVYAQLGSKVTVRAKYNDKYQYFYGEGNIETGAITDYDYLIGNEDSREEATRYKMRIVYDFKVDRLVCGWIPTEDTPIEGDKVIDCDILIIREHNEDANVIRFSDAGLSNPYNIKNVKTVYGVMQLNKSVMTDPTSYSQYAANQMYWVSFPFDVRVGAIFGISGYGTNWRIMKYNGERRAKEGFFVETPTFWEAMTEDEVMEANTGYLLNLSFPYFANPNSTVWAHGVLSVSLYFPSSESVDIISTQTRDIEVPAHECTIDRTFTKDGVEYNHKKTDSDWNIIGIPSFEPLKGNEMLTNENFYLWEVIDGAQTYTPQKGTDPDFNFKPTMAYMVQFGGTLNWKAGSTPVIPSPFAAPARTKENTNYTLDLRLLNSEEKMLDRTYVKLEDEASDEFELNEDMLKIDNPKYNFFARTADGYATGASNISFRNQTIELGGSVAKEQEYTIRLNRSVNCDVRLIDRVEGTTTNLNIMDYTTTIPAGSLGNRFALRIQTSQDVVTGFENTVTDKDDIKKFMIDGILYIQHNGTVYDAMGRRQY